MLVETEQIRDGVARFGVGLRHDIARFVREQCARRVLVLSTPGHFEMATEVAANLGPLSAGIFSKAKMHTPVHVTEAALAHLSELKADCLVSIGGGSTIGLGKAVAFRSGVPHVAIPTTYAGSEATPILGQTEDGVKTTFTDPAVLPGVVIYDPELVASLPKSMTVASGLNAIAHAVEALYAPERTPESDHLARDGLLAMARGLPAAARAPGDLDARMETQRGAWACGRVLGQVGMSLHHKLCHTLGGSFGLPHADTHAVVLPHAIAYNAQSASKALAPVVEVLGGPDAGAALYDFARSMGAPLALRDLGLLESDLDRAADLATRSPYPNPCPITRSGVRALLQAAWAGNLPAF